MVEKKHEQRKHDNWEKRHFVFHAFLWDCPYPRFAKRKQRKCWFAENFLFFAKFADISGIGEKIHSFISSVQSYPYSWPRVGGGRQQGRLVKLWKAPSRLYRRRYLHPHTNFAAFFEIYNFCKPLHRPKVNFSDLRFCKIFAIWHWICKILLRCNITV